MGIRFGFRTGSFRGWTVERAAAELAGMGYDCIEVCLEAPDVRPEELTEARCAALASCFHSLGIALASVSYHGDAEPLPQRSANQERAIRVAGWLGAPIVVINGEKATDRTRQVPEHVARLQRLCELADQEDVIVAVEPEPLLIVGSSQDMQEMLRAVGSPRLGVNLDIGHAQLTDADVPTSIRSLGTRVVHLHLEDIKGRVHRHLPFGAGDIDFHGIRQALADVGYRGPYVADLFGLDDPVQAGRSALAELRRLFA